MGYELHFLLMKIEDQFTYSMEFLISWMGVEFVPSIFGSFQLYRCGIKPSFPFPAHVANSCLPLLAYYPDSFCLFQMVTNAPRNSMLISSWPAISRHNFHKANVPAVFWNQLPLLITISKRCWLCFLLLVNITLVVSEASVQCFYNLLMVWMWLLT